MNPSISTLPERERDTVARRYLNCQPKERLAIPAHPTFASMELFTDGGRGAGGAIILSTSAGNVLALDYSASDLRREWRASVRFYACAAR